MTTTEPADGDPVVVTVDLATTAVVRGTVSLDEIRDFFDQPFWVLGEVLAHQQVRITGAAFSRYQGEAEDRWEVYLTEPSPEMDPNELRTALNWTIR